MELRPGAPFLTRPYSPTKQVLTLANIPEATPGPNAFAQRAERMERHRIEGNAFYQQEVQKWKPTPPTATHPALRPRASSISTSPPAPAPPLEQRESTVTTMSPFVDAGKGYSPPLKLAPSPGKTGEPTHRGLIEERRELHMHASFDAADERTPVYSWAPTPKPANSEFAKSTSTPKKKTRLSLPKKEATADEPPKSPKKSFFDRLRMTKLSGSASPTASTFTSDDATLKDSAIPVKAQAVLGMSTSKPGLSRSPSKRKGLFASRKDAPAADADASKVSVSRVSVSTDQEEASRTTSTRSKTPQAVSSDLAQHNHDSSGRVQSQTLSEQGAEKAKDAGQCLVVRSQSLKYFDSAPPPTPPAKNTPPEAKGNQQAAEKNTMVPRIHEVEATPSKAPADTVSTNCRLSPTRFGSYGNKEMPTLVTRPSVYSLHASVVPELVEPTAFEEMKARIDGLGLEGFNLPPENVHHSPDAVYSPSVYGSEFNGRPQTVIRTPRNGHHFTAEDLPSVPEDPIREPEMVHKPKRSNSSGGTIELYYPELAKDPSMKDMISGLYARPSFVADQSLPVHGRTCSHDHSNSPRDSTDASLFALPIDESLRETKHASPASFSQQSAVPSPLHYLPATVYSPPPARASRKRTARTSEVSAREGGESPAHGLGIRSRERSVSGSPTRNNNPLANAPILQAQSRSSNRSSPRPSINGLEVDPSTDVDPKKPQTIVPAESDKQDQMLDMLNRILARNTDIESIREEMRATNTRLDERLAAVETLRQQNASPPTTLGSLDSTAQPTQHEPRAPRRVNQQRITTNVARDFYNQHAQGARQGSSPPPGSAGTGSSEARSTESDTIADLRETNRRLVDMVTVFAEKIEGLERRVGGGV